MEWVTLDYLAGILRLPKAYLRQLTRKGFLVSIGRADKARWLNPTEEYREKLRLAAILHSEQMFVPPDISEIALLTLREVAVLCGWTLNAAQCYMKQNHVPHHKINRRLNLYDIRTVRELLWRRQERTTAHQRSPYLIQELIDFVQKEHEAATRDIPTDAEYAEDDKLIRKLESIVTRSEADQASAKHDFARKAELARRVVQLLEKARTAEQSTDPKAS